MTTNEAPLLRHLARISTLTRSIRQVWLAELNLDVGQDMLLDQLSASTPRSVTAVAAALDIRPSTVSKMVTRLAADGLIAREPDPNDRRLTQLRLTERGEALQARMRAAFTRIEEDLRKHLTGGVTPVMLDEMERLRAALAKQAAKLR